MALFEDTQYRFSDVRPVVEGAAAYATLRYDMDVVVVSEQFESGRHPIHMSGVGTVIFAQHDGAWKIRHLHMARDKGEVKEE